MRAGRALRCLVFASLALGGGLAAQVPPGPLEVAAYEGLLLAATRNDPAALKREIAAARDLDRRDTHGRTALHVAAFFANHAAMRALAAAGADVNALEHDSYDIVTIAAVANDVETLGLALELGCKADNITSRYRGTALIAAAHLGNVESVERLVAAGAPLDHVNNLGWTALIEAIVLGDGGLRHTQTVQRLVEAGADIYLADRDGRSPPQLASERGYTEITRILHAVDK